MQMQGSRALAATQQQTWNALNDPQVLRACVPGCDKFEAIGGDQYAVGTLIKIGPVSAKFTGKVSLSELDAPNSYKLAFEGQGAGAGFGKGVSSVRLVAAGAGCDLSYTVDAQVGGKIAQLGQRLIDGVSKSMADEFFKKFEAQLIARHPELAERLGDLRQQGAGAIAGSDESGLALHVLAKQLWRDFSNPPWTYVGASACGAAVMLALLWLSNG